MRAVVSDLLLKAPRTQTGGCQRVLAYVTEVLWNIFSDNVVAVKVMTDSDNDVPFPSQILGGSAR